MPTSSTCILCDKPAAWIRHTQFAGSHEFCDDHARAEDDFLVEDSTKDWEYVGGDAAVKAVVDEIATSRVGYYSEAERRRIIAAIIRAETATGPDVGAEVVGDGEVA